MRTTNCARARTARLVTAGALALLAWACLAHGTAQTGQLQRSTQVIPREPAPALGEVVVTDLQLGAHVSSDNRIPVPKTMFRPVDTIYASVSTLVAGGDPVDGSLGVHWTYGPARQSVWDEAVELRFTGAGATAFQISKPDGWPAGQYQVEVFLNGKPVRTARFEVL